jgi:hypothetical protein
MERDVNEMCLVTDKNRIVSLYDGGNLRQR